MSLLNEVKALVSQGEASLQSEDNRKSKQFYTKEIDTKILEVFKEYAKQWGSTDTRGKQAIAAIVAQKTDRTPNSVFYRLTRVLLVAESLDKVEYRNKKEKVSDDGKEADVCDAKAELCEV
jgi:Na+-transporting methylmalonyl-CoA/oxaloacetate decarboxylase gamma subunit